MIDMNNKVEKPDNADKMAVPAKGLKFILAGVLVMAAGFILMSGGSSKDPQVFNYAMFDFRRIVAAPVVVLAGITIIIIAIIGNYRDKRSDNKK